ncbi:arylsulfatase [Spirosoma panaciterrae]|uniref:arylsulfatase n=1 Tax=Spirosoma panaciterrae TaxID=496058 RepID=UPI000475BE64|nr:arylsulfatase [Spirosoma panaciterrae]
MKRILNNRLTVVSLFIGLLILSTLLSFQPRKVAEQRPNMIFILADDMGFSDIGCYGGEVSTPNLDQLAANGIKLRSFYNNARCCPTRASLLTGQYPHTAGMGQMVTMPNVPIQPGSYQGFLDERYPTIAERLKPAGYSTYIVGKWHVGERRQHWPLTRGFDRYFGLISGASSYYEIIPAEKGKRFIVEDDKEFTPPTDGFYMTDAFTDHAINYLNEQKQQRADNPFFLYVAYTAPHFPLHAYESDVAKYEKLYAQGWDVIRANRYKRMQKLGYADKRYPLTPRPADIPDWNSVTDKAQWVRKMAVYAAMIDRMDQNIGRLIKTLKANGQYENTLIVFMSDNGSSNENVEGRKLNDPNKKIGEKGSYVTYDTPWANVSNTPFRKYKRFVHEGGMITPCIMQWPRGIRPQAGYVEGIGHIMDLVPTSLELAGLSNKELPGKSLSYLWGKNRAVSRTYCWEHEGNKAIRKADWKLEKDTEDADWELYNLKADPCEMTNLAQKQPQLAAELRAEYDRWAQQVGVRERPAGKSE